MKIYSKFKDYYDTAMAYGVDDHLHWMRDLQEIDITKPRRIINQYRNTKTDHGHYPFFDSDLYNESPRDNKPYFGRRVHYSSNPDLEWETQFVGFCGKVYPLLKFNWTERVHQEHSQCAYNTDDIIKILKAYDKCNKTKKLANFLNKPDKKRRWSYYADRTQFKFESMQKYFDKWTGSELFGDYFIEHNIPTFSIIPESKKLILNSRLLDYEFQKIMDSYTAYQEIEMFMGGVLGLIEPDITNIEDKYLAEAKGFDEWSFKTIPTKRK